MNKETLELLKKTIDGEIDNKEKWEATLRKNLDGMSPQQQEAYRLHRAWLQGRIEIISELLEFGHALNPAEKWKRE